MQKLNKSPKVHCGHQLAEPFIHSEEKEEPGVGMSFQVLMMRAMLWVCDSLVSTEGILGEVFPTWKILQPESMV